jgi:hypothetical protein
MLLLCEFSYLTATATTHLKFLFLISLMMGFFRAAYSYPRFKPHYDTPPEALGNRRRIAALKEVHELGIKTFVSVEP